MAINVQVEKNNNESSANVIRRFTKRVQGAGILKKVRDQRYYSREKSANVNKMAKLKKLAKKETYEKMLKLGKISEPKSFRR
jgi:ribosomal protein S21